MYLNTQLNQQISNNRDHAYNRITNYLNIGGWYRRALCRNRGVCDLRINRNILLIYIFLILGLQIDVKVICLGSVNLTVERIIENILINL